jgi:hypothetical protein
LAVGKVPNLSKGLLGIQLWCEKRDHFGCFWSRLAIESARPEARLAWMVAMRRGICDWTRLWEHKSFKGALEAEYLALKGTARQYETGR